MSRGRAPAGRGHAWQAAVQRFATLRAAGRAVVVAGESGAGKLSLALGRPAAGAPTGAVLDLVERNSLAEVVWAERVRAALVGGGTVLCGLDQLDPAGTDSLRAIVRSTDTAPVLTMTADSLEDAARVAARFDASVVWTPALRDRPEDVEELWGCFAAELAPDLPLRPDAVAALRMRPWPDNLRSLRALVDGLAARGHHGPVSALDLDPGSRTRASSLMEQTERETIERALAAAGGNRARAAELLGLSRATVYRKVKAYRLGE